VTAVYDEVPVVLRTDGTVWTAPDKLTFKPIVAAWGAAPATEIAASGSGDYGTAVGCAIVTGNVWCFPLGAAVIDSTDLGAGLGTNVTTSTAVRVVTGPNPSAPALTGAVHLAGGTNGSGASFCAVTSAGRVWCWGHNPNGVLGRGDTADTSYAGLVVARPDGSPLSNALEVRIGYVSACARLTDGTVWCWGDDGLGELGAMGEGSSLIPLHVRLAQPAVRLAASPGDTHCAILQDTSVACWGWNQYAQAGAPDSNLVAQPTVVTTGPVGAALLGVVDVAPDHQMQAMCANVGGSGLRCWGNAFAPEAGARAVTPFPVAPSDGPSGVDPGVSLGAYGASDGSLVYVNSEGLLAFGAGAPGYSVQPPCP
jgi:hypothetical protein